MDLRVYFLGICTHMEWHDTVPRYMDRVVLYNATAGDEIDGQPIQSHVPTLRIAVRDIIGQKSLVLPGTSGGIVEWRLDGVRVRIENATDPVDRDATFFTCIPSLSKLVPDIGVPSKAAVDDGVRELAACIFDVTGGTLYGRANKQSAAFGFLETATDGDPVISITPFDDPTGEPGKLTLRPGAEISLSNVGATEKHDSAYDFYLHYRLAGRMPEHPRLPDPPTTCIVPAPGHTWPPGFQSVDVGCSNSIYP